MRLMKLRRVMCAVFNHPRVVDVCFGQVTCARCGAILGDVLSGVYPLKGRTIKGHDDCDDCKAVKRTLRWHERVMT